MRRISCVDQSMRASSTSVSLTAGVFGAAGGSHDSGSLPKWRTPASPKKHEGASRAPGGEVGALAISQTASDQQSAGPQSALRAVVFAGIEIGQFQISPIIQPWPLDTLTGREALPSRSIERLHDLFGRPGHVRLARPGVELVG